MKNTRFPEPRIWKTLSPWDEDNLDHHRILFCPFYEQCLDFAAKLGWPGFTCIYCPLHPKNRKEAKEWKQEILKGGRIRKPSDNWKFGIRYGVPKTK